MIGGTRIEEAKTSDSAAGYHQFHDEETGEPHGSFEVFWHKGGPLEENTNEAGQDWDFDDSEQDDQPGWYWHACFPGCMPDGEPEGPFARSWLAKWSADPWSAEHGPL